MFEFFLIFLANFLHPNTLNLLTLFDKRNQLGDGLGMYIVLVFGPNCLSSIVVTGFVSGYPLCH